MRISLNWLRQYIDISESVDELASILTSLGLEVESVETVEALKGGCLLYTSPSPRDGLLSRMPSSA